MFTKRWQIFRLFGIPFFIDVTWLIILAMLSWTLASVFRSEFADRHWLEYGVFGLGAALAFFACILLHELGHAVVAKLGGMPVRGITLFLFGGVADLGREPPSPGSELVMAIAGPIVSLVLAIVFGAMGQFGKLLAWPAELILFADLLAAINVSVLIFNMVPAFPLDGGRVLRSILWGALGDHVRATWWAALAGQAFAWFLIAVAIVQLVGGNAASALWLGLIGLFLRGAASGAYQQVVYEQALEGEPVSRVMNDHPVVVPPTLDLRHWVEDYVYRHQRRSFPVVTDGHLRGVVNLRDLGKCPRDQWERHTVGELMHRNLADICIPPDAEAIEALRRMERAGVNRLLVTDGDQLLGVVSLSDLSRFLELKLETKEMEE